MRWSNLENDSFECLWLYLRPKRLPRPLSGIVIAAIYHPPCLPVKEHDDLNEYLINTADLVRNKYPDHGLVFVGDFRRPFYSIVGRRLELVVSFLNGKL